MVGEREARDTQAAQGDCRRTAVNLLDGPFQFGQLTGFSPV